MQNITLVHNGDLHLKKDKIMESMFYIHEGQVDFCISHCSFYSYENIETLNYNSCMQQMHFYINNRLSVSKSQCQQNNVKNIMKKCLFL